jgi:predicted phosphodiesterase
MRLAILSDIHGNLHAFEAVLQDLASAGEIDLFWCLGDYAAFGTRPAECVAKLRELQAYHGEKKFKLIGGNTDRYIVTGKRPEMPAAKDAESFAKRVSAYQESDDLHNWALSKLSWEDYEFLAKMLGKELFTRVEGYGEVIGFHAIPGNDEPMSLRPDTPDEEAADALLDRSGHMAIAGHTHKVMDRTLRNWRVINPGSIGLSFTDFHFAEWALINFENGEANVDFRRVPYDIQAVLADIEASGYPHPNWLLNRLK